jgi:hypothetical protein
MALVRTHIHGVTTSFNPSHFPAKEGAPVLFPCASPCPCTIPPSCPCFRFCPVCDVIVFLIACPSSNFLHGSRHDEALEGHLGQNSLYPPGAIGPRGAEMCRRFVSGWSSLLSSHSHSLSDLSRTEEYIQRPYERGEEVFPLFFNLKMLQRTVIRATRATTTLGRRYATNEAGTGGNGRAVLVKRVAWGVGAGFAIAMARDWVAGQDVSTAVKALRL